MSHPSRLLLSSIRTSLKAFKLPSGNCLSLLASKQLFGVRALSSRPKWQEKEAHKAKLSNGKPLSTIYFPAQDSDVARSMGLPVLPNPNTIDTPALLTRSQIEQYLPPLFRRGWEVEWQLRCTTVTDGMQMPLANSNMVAQIITGAVAGEETPCLARRYHVHARYGGAISDFAEDLQLVVNSDYEFKQVSDSMSLDYGEAPDDSTELTVRIRSDRAREPADKEVTYWQPTSGLTMSDIRYAILIEWIHHSYFKRKLLNLSNRSSIELSPEIVDRLTLAY